MLPPERYAPAGIALRRQTSVREDAHAMRQDMINPLAPITVHGLVRPPHCLFVFHNDHVE